MTKEPFSDVLARALTEAARASQRGVCGAPGPFAAHCTDYPGHRYSCYDAREDVSFNDRQDWLAAHDCGEHECPDKGYQAEDR